MQPKTLAWGVVLGLFLWAIALLIGYTAWLMLYSLWY